MAQLLARDHDLARGWLLAVLEQAELHEAAGVLASELAVEGPRLCAAVVRALADDAELALLREDGALEPLAARAGELLGAASLADALRAVDALSAVIWSAAVTAWPAADGAAVAALADRLADVTALVRIAVLRRLRDGGEELAAPALWQRTLSAEIEAADRDDRPLALLLVELDDPDRLRSAATGREAEDAFERFTQAIGSIVRSQDILARESVDRSWLIARDTERRGAEALARRAIDALREGGAWRGAPLAASAGVAVLGEDGDDAEDLIAAAEQSCLAAAASGAGLLSRDEPAGGGA